MPIANGFLEPKDVASEYFFELEVGYCPESRMVQLTQLVEKERLFHDHYAFFSSTSRRMAEHFERFATDVRERYIEDPANAFVCEIGSNDASSMTAFTWPSNTIGRTIMLLGFDSPNPDEIWM